MTGTIKRLVVEKGFGFIVTDGDAQDIFFHSTSVVAPTVFSTLQGGAKVSFDIEESVKGPRAANVVLIQ